MSTQSQKRRAGSPSRGELSPTEVKKPFALNDVRTRWRVSLVWRQYRLVNLQRVTAPSVLHSFAVSMWNQSIFSILQIVPTENESWKAKKIKIMYINIVELFHIHRTYAVKHCPYICPLHLSIGARNWLIDWLCVIMWWMTLNTTCFKTNSMYLTSWKHNFKKNIHRVYL